MNILYTTQRLQELFCDDEDPQPMHANVSGDGDGGPGQSCRLCGGDNNLRYFGDTYVRDGVEERYDQLLNECFGVKVTQSDHMICEWCVRALRTTDHFRALVQAAFDQPSRDYSSNPISRRSGNRMNNDTRSAIPATEGVPPKKSLDYAKKREDRRRIETKSKRVNVPCEVCKQRYQMLASECYGKTFICSRCKKNSDLRGSVCRKCNVVLPSAMINQHLELHSTAHIKSRTRVEERKRTQYNPCTLAKAKPPKYQCSRCSKKYSVARHLEMHIRNSHSDSYEMYKCANYSQNFETRDRLQEHLVDQSRQKCDECLLVFKNKKALRAHSIRHHASSNTS